MIKEKLLLTAAMAFVFVAPTHAHAQITGTIDNFDVVDDTGSDTEGFEIEVDDIHATDLTREFPSNFTGQEYVNRFGIPDVVQFDETATGGKKGVRITWHSNWDGTKWVAKFGSYQYLGTYPQEGNAVKFVAKPVATQGDQCWLLGQGTGYATSGCDHFGLSFIFGVTPPPAKIFYHWLVPNPAAVGTLMRAPWGGVPSKVPYLPPFPPSPPVPPVPMLVYNPPVVIGQPPVIHAVAEAAPPENPDPAEPHWGKATWVKTFTSRSKMPANLDALQKNLVQLKGKKGSPVAISWALLQMPPAGQPGEKMEVEDNNLDGGNVAVTHRYEYYEYTGVYDLTTYEAICAPLLNGDCTNGPKVYNYVDNISGEAGPSRKVNEKGRFLGAHMAGFNMPN